MCVYPHHFQQDNNRNVHLIATVPHMLNVGRGLYN
jgi:hypothetical protein